ncbi:hypothetical protein E1301_Tti008100 [Triplophysa tibetana]|uniref:C2H2-type domain-containing protein n=1 Tax=Triplophysa tibetana TaxID=1572043 RepID=A0A5A9NHT8_9TELE|nr:hypothetical protein E1301_Tti008100 [Triplophysa tibetana]
MGKNRTIKHNKCCVCSQSYNEKNLDAHVHTYTHHEAIAKILGSKQVGHRCWACNVSFIGLEQYKEHIAKDEHRHNLFKLKGKRKLKVNLPVDYDTMLNAEIKNLCNEERPQRCFVCRHSFCEWELDIHKHSMVHHVAIENLKGSEQVHKCWACDLSVMGICEYKKHIGTAIHKINMAILKKRRSDNDKSAVDYREEFDDELKALCTQRDLQTNKKKEVRFLKWMQGKEVKIKGKQKAPQTKLIQKFPMKNMSQSFQVPAKAGEDFTSDQLPTQCKLFHSLEDQQKISTSRPEPTTLKRRQESTLEENVESHIERVVRQTCESYCEKELFRGRTKSKKKHKKQEQSTEYVSSHSSQKSTGEPCSRDAFYTLRNSQQDQIDTNKQQEQCMSRKHINGQEASVASPSSVSSLAEKIGSFHSRAKATCNVNICQILDVGGNDSFRNDTNRGKKNGYNAETSQENLDEVQIIPCNPRKDQDISNPTHQNPETTCRQNKVNKLMTMSSREEELTNSLSNVGDQLFQAYGTLQTAYMEVQNLLTAKQQVTSEMSSLRAKRIQLLKDMIE